MAVTTLY